MFFTHNANSKEFISLDKAAKQDFKPETRYDLLSGNADSFAADLEKYAKHFGYGFLLNVPSTCVVYPANTNAFTYSDQVHMLETWNQVTDASIAINANEIWGTRDWTQGTPIGNIFQFAEMTAACGEIGAANLVTLIGCKKFLGGWKSTILSQQIMEMLTPEAQILIKLHKSKYQWTDPLPNETIDDGGSLMNKVLKLICPDVQTNVYAELAKIKTIKLVDYAFNIIKWHSVMIRGVFSLPLYFGIYFGILMVDRYLTCFATLKVMEDSFSALSILIVDDTVNEHVQFHDGYGGATHLN